MSLKSKKQSVKKAIAPYGPHLTSLYLEKDDMTFARLYLVITKQYIKLPIQTATMLCQCCD